VTSSDREGAALGRPSLFAAHDHRNHAAADPDGVRILSTLESQQNTPPRRRVGDLATRTGGSPLASNGTTSRPGWAAGWMLWGLVTAGLALAGAGLWLAGETSAPPSHLPSTATPVAMVKPAAAAESPSPTAPLAAVIENSPLQAGPATQAITRSDEAMAAAPEVAPAEMPSPQPKKRPADKALVTAHKAKPKTHGKADDDVALLEAMFTHAGKRQAPSSATQQLTQQCGPLSGAEARACQTRVCQQFPAASVCR
jgi:hypothetical protein